MMEPTTKLRYVPIEDLGPATRPNPIQVLSQPGGPHPEAILADAVWIRSDVEVRSATGDREILCFEKAGPRRHIFFDPAQTRAAIVTCGGLCPGLNEVIRSLFMELNFGYRIAEILGIRFGYQGLNPALGHEPIVLTRDFTSQISRLGGTALGTSRGPQDVGGMVDFLVRRHINILFCIGGDGTQRGAAAIAREVARRGLKIAVVGIPKTIDNDILFCERTFGYVTAVERASDVIHLAHNEAKSQPRCIGLVKVMGRSAGFIACLATLACQEVNFVLIPELPFDLHGERGFLAALRERIDSRQHAVIVVAEGAGQHLFQDEPVRKDKSGNVLQHDIGLRLKQEILAYFQGIGQPVDIKYIDPSYIIRSVQANCDDTLLCDQLARRAVHAAMAGKTNLIVGYLNSRFIHVPIAMAVAQKKQVELDSELWASVLAATGQPARLGR